MEELHPNWRALATVHLPLKRFLREGASSQNSCTKDINGHSYEIHNVDGKEVKLFYETLTRYEKPKTPSTEMESQQINEGKVPKSITNKRLLVRKPFDALKFFRFAMENNVQGLKEFECKDHDIDICDAFGWTALMMAACAGATETVKLLLEMGASKELKEKSGKTALDLAKKKAHVEIVTLLEIKKRSNEIELEKSQEEDLTVVPYYCDICSRDFQETSYQQHLTSTVHQFNAKSKLPAANKLNKFNIPPRNRGLQLMLKQGWDKESGLGPVNSGRLYPIKTVIRKQRTGLGIEQQPARITHFEAFDLRATKSANSDYYKRKPRNRNDMRREKQREWKRERRLRRELS